MKEISEDDIKLELDQLVSKLFRFKEKYGDRFEFSLQTAIYSNRKRLVSYKEYFNILNLNNYSFYIKRFEISKRRFKEFWRFFNFLKLKEFLVVYRFEDDVDVDLLEDFETDKLVEGETYVVTSHAFINGKLYFQLRHRFGEKINNPIGVAGFDSLRFDLVDYTKLN